MMLFSKLKDSDFIIHRDFFSHGIHFIELSTVNHGIRCPSCHAFITKVKEYRLKRIVHDIYEHSHTIILFRHRRFICPHCRHTIMEDNPFSSSDSNISDFTILAILDELKRYNVPFLQVACRHDFSVTKIQSIFDSYVDLPRNPLPDVLCMDEFYFSRKRDKKYCLIMIDFYNHAIIDVLKDRTKHTMLAYFRSIDLQERSFVRYLIIDMNDIYRDIASYCFPKAILAVDSFHVIKSISDAVDRIRKKVMRRFKENPRSNEYYLLKYRRDLLFVEDIHGDRYTKVEYNHHFHYEISDLRKLEMMLSIDPELNRAYELYHRYLQFNKKTYADLDKARKDLNKIIQEFRLARSEELYKIAEMFDHWEEEIIHSFIVYRGKRLSNGPIEKKNGMIKKILKIANGYGNFKRFRNRGMYTLNKRSMHTYPVTLEDLKDD